MKEIQEDDNNLKDNPPFFMKYLFGISSAASISFAIFITLYFVSSGKDAKISDISVAVFIIWALLILTSVSSALYLKKIGYFKSKPYKKKKTKKANQGNNQKETEITTVEITSDKQKNKPTKYLMTIIAILICLSVSVSLNVKQHFDLNRKAESVEVLNVAVGEKESIIDSQKNMLVDDLNKIRTIQLQRNSFETDLIILKKLIVFVPNDGTNHYHRYDCYDFNKNSDYRVYTEKEAKEKGYSKCQFFKLTEIDYDWKIEQNSEFAG